jgi:tetratricopeptide (TPR) repeat protein
MNKHAAFALALALAVAPAAHAARPADYLVAQFAAHQGDLKLAATRMQGALAGDPSSPELREDAFVLALLAGSPEAASLAHTLPNNPLAQLLLAAAAAREGHWPQAELGFAELPHQPLADALRPLLVAWAQLAQGFPDRAMDTLQPALADTRLGAIALLHAALLADAAHRDGLAQRLYTDLAHAQTQPSLQFAQILAGWQARSGDMEAARATLDRAVRAAPELAVAQPALVAALAHPAPPTAAHGLAQVLVEAAASSGQQNTHDVGELLVQVALTVEPGMTEAQLLAAEIASGHHQWRLAAAALERISPTDPLAAVVQLRLASLYERDDRPAEAIRVLTRLADALPDRPEPLAQLGDTLAGEKKFTEAVSAYDRAIALMPHPAASDWVLFYARGASLERLHEWPRAQADMNRALELSPDQPVVLNFLGYSMADRNQNLAAAQDMIQRALHARPNDGAIVDSLGWVKLRLGDTHEALRLLERAAELEPEDPSITGHLGDAYWTAGRHLEAADQWRRALVLKPDPDEQARIEGRLRTVAQ